MNRQLLRATPRPPTKRAIAGKTKRNLSGPKNQEGQSLGDPHLRSAAEEQLGRSPGAARAMQAEAPEEIIHELQVHQIELEMQNEELKRAQEALEESRDRYQDLYDFAPVGYFSFTRVGRIVEANLTGAALLGVPRAMLIHRGFGSFVAPEDLDQWERHLVSVVQSKVSCEGGNYEKQSCELPLRLTDGSTFHVRLESIRLAPPPSDLPDGHEPSAGSTEAPVIRTAMIDITERKNADEALSQAGIDLARSNKELEQFAYVASHDLQEPLRQVVGFLQLLRDQYEGKLDEKADEFIHYAVDGGLRMSKLISDLLAYARIGTRGEEPSLISCQEALDSALANLRAAISENSVRVTHDALPTLVADGAQIAQLFQNLIGNALKFRREGVPPEIHVGARQEGDEWVFWVKDNGIGIPPEQFDRVFAIFQRLHGIDEYPGTGIGLAICKKIMERHHGRIWIESTVGAGTTFFFSLPSS